MADVADGNNVFRKLALILNSEEESVRLILSLFAGYPLAFVYRTYIRNWSENLQHIFFMISGLSLCYFNFGFDTIHSVVNILVIWGLISVLGGTAVSVAIAFIFNTAYLLFGYYYVSGDVYDISWTTPHCVLILKLTGLVFDLYDGKKSQDKLSAEQQESVLLQTPSLLEIAGYSYYFGGFLVGPQFSMTRYQAFIRGLYLTSDRPLNNASLAIERLFLGVVYIAAFHCILTPFLTDRYMITKNFSDLNFFIKCAYITVWGKLHMCKYIGCWLIVEGACILTGLTYNGQDSDGRIQWDGCTNVRVYQFETSSTFREVVASFNINTNHWMSKYVFKRAKFLGNKLLSQAITLLYLAIWHGVHTGYYMNFFLELIMMNGETQIKDFVQKAVILKNVFNHTVIKPGLWIIRKILVQFFISYSLVSFVHLKWHRYLQVYSSLYYVGHVVFFILPLLCFVPKNLLKSLFSGVHQINDTMELNGKKGS